MSFFSDVEFHGHDEKPCEKQIALPAPESSTALVPLASATSSSSMDKPNKDAEDEYDSTHRKL